jgi:exonuclease III
MDNIADLRICSFNCRSVKNSLSDVRSLCITHDIVLLQEHWLLPFDLGLLSGISDDFLAFGLSAVDVAIDILKGRPYGGTAILYRKQFAKLISIVSSNEPRLCCARIVTCEGPVLLVNVYMPYHANDDASYDEYVDLCTKINAIFTDIDCVYLIVMGDFNCKLGSRFYEIFTKFLADCDLICVDMQKLNGVFTFISDDGLRTSWIDHIVTSKPLMSRINDVRVLYGNLCSDHRPLSVCFGLFVSMETCSVGNTTRCADKSANWSKVTSSDVDRYQLYLAELLSKVDIPCCLLSCRGGCGDLIHKQALADYYNDIINNVKKATCDVIPLAKSGKCDYSVPGWDDYVEDKHDAAREAFFIWMDVGKPRSGLIYEQMYRSRAVFKQALRFCQRHKEQIQADACARACFDTDPRKFWQNVSKTANVKATRHVNKIGDCSGESDICYMWQNYFKNLYNSVPDGGARDEFRSKLLCVQNGNGMRSGCFSVDEVASAICGQKKSKCAGPNGLAMESFIYAHAKLWIHLSLFFTFCIKHCFLPADFMELASHYSCS